MKISYVIFISSCILFSSVIPGCGNKEEENKNSQKVQENKTATQNTNSVPNQNNTPVSEIGKTWKKIDQINNSMSKSINSGKPGHMEEPVAEILALLKSIPEISANISEAALETLKTNVNELRKIGILMDKYQHANKLPELKEEYAKFAKTLDELKSELQK